MKAKATFALLVLAIWSGTAFAGPPSLLGGKPLPGGTAHRVGAGWPSLLYEWWHAGNPDWAIGGELVYGEWSGEYSDVEIGGAFNVPLRWHIGGGGAVDVAFRLTPGVLFGSAEERREDDFVFGLRGEFGIPITIDLSPEVNLVTGVMVPFSAFFVDDADDYVVIPILPRIGAELKATNTITPWLLLELGPAIAAGEFGSDVDFAFRVWVGSTFR
ncbi:MAG: hypothetical protein AB1640_23265 [bacterium]